VHVVWPQAAEPIAQPSCGDVHDIDCAAKPAGKPDGVDALAGPPKSVIATSVAMEAMIAATERYRRRILATFLQWRSPRPASDGNDAPERDPVGSPVRRLRRA
jgi:hypothetical protein